MDAITNSQATALENTYYAALNASTTAKEWNDLAVKFEDYAERIRCVGATERKAELLEKAEDCYSASRRAARGSHEIYPRRSVG